jgi:hypothetical protein
MLKKTRAFFDRALLFVSTNLLALAIVGIFDAVYFAAYWYWNVNLGHLPEILALGFLIVVNLWLVYRHRLH